MLIHCVMNFTSTPHEQNFIKSFLQDRIKQALGASETPRLSDVTSSTNKDQPKSGKNGDKGAKAEAKGKASKD